MKKNHQKVCWLTQKNIRNNAFLLWKKQVTLGSQGAIMSLHKIVIEPWKRLYKQKKTRAMHGVMS